PAAPVATAAVIPPPVIPGAVLPVAPAAVPAAVFDTLPGIMPREALAYLRIADYPAFHAALGTTGVDRAWETLKPGETVGVTFRLGHKKCMFSPTVHSVAQQGNQLVVTLSRPKGMHQLKRRVYHRVPPPPGVVVPVRFWRKESSAPAEREARDVRHGQLEDISAGGMRVKTADCTDVEVGTTYECVFAPRQGAPALILDATLRHREAVDQARVSLGFQFIGFETSADGRRALDRLARIVTQFRRVNHPAG
ncbi:MAG: PilZ domain-containing protein, partial [Planctomycetes bacterium]|nr:PilZ domain-containing protein [Planctomycetota bacterium]